MSTFRWGIFGTGAISAKFALDLKHAKNARATMVASRDGQSAQTFAKAFGVDRAVEGYPEAARLGEVDAIYIATPPSVHHAHALTCLQAGIPVLIEKPFALNAEQASDIAEAARSAKVFCMEGLWTRFLPAAQRMRTLLRAGVIGEPRQVSGSFGTAYRPDPAHGNFDPARGGGALAHLGVYPLSLAQWLFGAPTAISALARFGETGVDEDIVLTLRYPDDVLASFHASLRATAANDFRIMGDQGSVGFRGPIFRPYGLAVRRDPPRARPLVDFSLKARLRESSVGQTLAQVAGQLGLRGPTGTMHFYSGNGYHYEADEVRRCVEAGLTESSVMPLNDSLAIAATINQIRNSVANSVVGDKVQ